MLIFFKIGKRSRIWQKNAMTMEDVRIIVRAGSGRGAVEDR